MIGQVGYRIKHHTPKRRRPPTSDFELDVFEAVDAHMSCIRGMLLQMKILVSSMVSRPFKFRSPLKNGFCKINAKIVVVEWNIYSFSFDGSNVAFQSFRRLFVLKLVSSAENTFRPALFFSSHKRLPIFFVT